MCAVARQIADIFGWMSAIAKTTAHVHDEPRRRVVASKRPPEEMASVDELIEALNRLTVDERLRLWRQGDAMALGSEFASGRELFSEAVKRALIGTGGERDDGERGRPWPKTVDLVAFLMECMRSIANGSHHSIKQKVDRRAEALATEDGEENPQLAE